MFGNLIKYCVLSLFLTSVLEAQSQDLKQDMNKVMDFYSNVESFSCKVRMEVYSAGNQGNLANRCRAQFLTEFEDLNYDF